EVVESGIARVELADGLDDLARWTAQPGLLLDALAQRRHARRRARRSPRAALLVRIAHEAERREPLVPLVVGRLHLPERLGFGVGQVDPDAPAEILTELQCAAGPAGGIAIAVNNLLHHPPALHPDHAL